VPEAHRLATRAIKKFRPERITRIEAMKDRSLRRKNDAETAKLSKDIREKLDRIDQEMGLKLETLDYILADSKEYPKQFHESYVQPLMDSGLSLEDSFALLVDGILRPN
jgi:hypothetical protein